MDEGRQDRAGEPARLTKLVSEVWRLTSSRMPTPHFLFEVLITLYESEGLDFSHADNRLS